MTFVYLGIAVWVGVIIYFYARRLAAWRSRPLTATDRYCARADARLDELEARRATRPTGNCQVIPFPDIPRHRGGRGPWSLHLHDDESLREDYVDRDLSNWTDGPAA